MPSPNDRSPGAPLGQTTGYPDAYDRSQLFAMPRAGERAALGLGDALPFTGADVWTAYELTWLDPLGRPAVAIATIEIPAASPYIVESKSMKLYLGSFAMSAFGSPGAVAQSMERDLAGVVGAPVKVALRDDATFGDPGFAELAGESLDERSVACSHYEVASWLLERAGGEADETLTTRLFRSVCPVTGQPDLASVRIAYRGPRIDRTSLLRYLVSYRRQPAFHEHCVERIFVDLLAHCGCERLTVQARFVRRGGIDINPFRTNAGAPVPPNLRTARQ
jgi:7-cyano-7-deazaguanine reductase